MSSLSTEVIVRGYSGIRINSQGGPLRIYNGIIWQLKDDEGTFWGQRALFLAFTGNSEWYLKSFRHYGRVGEAMRCSEL
ncbi:MEKHLA domain-containing protein [Ewingella sp. S1.OA.A_B6]